MEYEQSKQILLRKISKLASVFGKIVILSLNNFQPGARILALRHADQLRIAAGRVERAKDKGRPLARKAQNARACLVPVNHKRAVYENHAPDLGVLRTMTSPDPRPSEKPI